MKEWRRLDGSVQALFKKQLAKRLQAPQVPSARHHGDLQHPYKIQLRDAGYGLVHEVIDQRLIVVVIAVGRRDHEAVSLQASRRTAPWAPSPIPMAATQWWLPFALRSGLSAHRQKQPSQCHRLG